MEFTGKTVEEAIKSAYKETGLNENNSTITVLEEPTKGIFGKLKGKGVINIEKKPDDNEKALEFVKEVLKHLEVNAKAELIDGEKPIINVIAEKSSEVIGYRGEVLDALQTLAGAALNIGKKEYEKITVNCENYRERREETLIKLAHKLEEKATEMRREVILEAMIPFERRIIHTALSNSETVTTKSEGKEPNRYVVIVPNDLDEYSKPYNAGRNSDRKHGKDDRHNNNRRGDKRGFKGGNRGGFKKSYGEAEKRKKPSSFGTYLGNSLKKEN